ncbi:MAG: 4Fe-4S dicluster domain-containing protein [Bacteroidales bacterium]
MPDFGFTIATTRAIDLDHVNYDALNQLEKAVPSFKRCIVCGACSSSCSSGKYTHFSIRKVKLLFRRGQYQGLKEELEKCMLCGKCTLVCPRGVNLRATIIQMRKILEEMPQSKN